MKLQFYIDRQFGHPIWINVEDGVIVEFPHEGLMENVLSERFKGWEIGKFKHEFEKLMQTTYHKVWCAEYSKLANRYSDIKNRMGYLKEMLSNCKTKAENKPLIEEQMKYLKMELLDAEKEQEQFAKILKDKFNFEV